MPGSVQPTFVGRPLPGESRWWNHYSFRIRQDQLRQGDGEGGALTFLAVQGDRIAGRETLPILLGKKKSLQFVRYTLVGAIIIPLILAGWLSPAVYGLALIPAFMLILTLRYKIDRDISADFYEFWFEFPLLFAGIVAAVG